MPDLSERGSSRHPAVGLVESPARTWLPSAFGDIPHLLPPDDFGGCEYRYNPKAQFESWQYGQGAETIEVTVAYPFKDRRTAFLPRIDISPSLRGQGLGRQVIDNIREYLAGRGYEYLVVVAEPLRRGEPDPRGFYQKVGFQPLDPWSYCQVMSENISDDPELELFLSLGSVRPS